MIIASRGYTEAVQYDIPGLFWTPLLRGICLGQLERRAEAAEQITLLLELKPDFKQKARPLIQHYVKEDSVADHIMGGLLKAGL